MSQEENTNCPSCGRPDGMLTHNIGVIDAPSPSSAHAAVKELEWVDNVAATPFGAYWIIAGYDGRVTLGAPKWSSGDWIKFPTEEEALLYAQTDFDGRVRSCVLSALPKAVPDVSEEMRKALAVYGQWVMDVATLGELASLERRMNAVGIGLDQLGGWTAALSAAQGVE